MANLVLRAATLIDGTGADPCYDAEVVVRDGVITHIGPAGVYADDAVVVDYGDATIMPGLIDCHCHLQFGAYESHERTLAVHKSASNEERVMTAIANGQRALATGVTTMRDTGGYLALNMVVRDALRSGQVPGPRLLVCGAPITTTGGTPELVWAAGGLARRGDTSCPPNGSSRSRLHQGHGHRRHDDPRLAGRALAVRPGDVARPCYGFTSATASRCRARTGIRRLPRRHRCRRGHVGALLLAHTRRGPRPIDNG